jgi:hypothetical protein
MSFLSSIISSLKAWLRRLLDDGAAFGHEQPRSIEEAAMTLVERARSGDQNAVGMICEIRDNAARGIERAKKTNDAIGHYLKTHPVEEDNSGDFGEDPEADIMAEKLMTAIGAEETDYVETVIKQLPPLANKNLKKAIVTIANGPSLVSNYRGAIDAFCEALPENERDAFAFGATKTALALSAMRDMPHECQHALILGYVLGKARQIQCVRIPNCPVSYQSTIAGEELD